MDETNTEETRWQMSNPTTGKKWKATCYDPLCELHNPNPTTGEWTLVPRALHFNIICGDTVLYEGVTSEQQGKHLVSAHNAALAAAVEALKRIDDGTTDFTTSGIVKAALEKVKDGK